MNPPLNLVKGQRIRLTDLAVRDSCRLDIAVSGVGHAGFLCLGLRADGKLLSGEYLIHSKREETPCRSIALHVSGPTSAGFQLNLATLPESIAEVVFLLSLDEPRGFSNGRVEDAQGGLFAVIHENGKVAEYAFCGSDLEHARAIILAKLYRKGDWRLGVVSSGFRGGLAACLSHFGVSGEDSFLESEGAGERSGDKPESTTHQVILPQDWPGGVAPGIPQGLTSAIGFIVVETAGESHSSGTGFVITPGGHILTCYHVVSDAGRMGIFLGGAGAFRALEYLAGDEEHDVALLRLTDGSGWPFWLPLARPEEEVPLGEPLGLLGYPLSFELGVNVTYSQGIVNSCRKRGDVPLLQIDAGAAPGSSGGPIFRRSDGRVVGMLQSGVERHGMLINLGWDIRAFWKLVSPSVM